MSQLYSRSVGVYVGGGGGVGGGGAVFCAASCGVFPLVNCPPPSALERCNK